MKPIPALLLTVILSPLLLAGPSSKIDDDFRREREKEAGRAKESATRLSDRKEFVEKYEYLKNKYPELYAAALSKQMEAAQSWGNAADRIAQSASREDMMKLKMSAQNSEDAAEIARLEMRAAAAETEWKNATEKYRSKEIRALAEQLMQNQKAIIQTTKQYKASQAAMRQLEIERTRLYEEMRAAQEKEQEKEHGKRDRDSSRDHEKDRAEKERREDRPAKVLVE